MDAGEFWLALAALTYIGTLLAIPHVLIQPKNPAEQLSWILSIVCLPIVGGMLYVAIGMDISSMRRLRRRAAHVPLPWELGDDPRSDSVPERPVDEQGVYTTLRNLNRLETTWCRPVGLFRNGQDFYDDLEATIAAAERLILIQFFIWRDDAIGQRFRDALIAKRKEGVQVFALIDEAGNFFSERRFFDPLIDAGAQVAWLQSFRKKPRRAFNIRNHRKLVAIDGGVGYVGGMNIGMEYTGQGPHGPWNDVQIKIAGPVVRQLEGEFAKDWNQAHDEAFPVEAIRPSPLPAPEAGASPVQVISGGPIERMKPILGSLLAVINAARRRLWLTTPYLVPNESLLMALNLAARRGVDVRLYVSRRTDVKVLKAIGRSYYEELMAYGVAIYEYPDEVNHAKIVVVDELYSLVGSANLDVRSLLLNFENAVFITDAGVNAQLADYMESCMKGRGPIDVAEWLRRPKRLKLAEGAARLLSPLL